MTETEQVTQLLAILSKLETTTQSLQATPLSSYHKLNLQTASKIDEQNEAYRITCERLNKHLENMKTKTFKLGNILDTLK